MRWGIVLAIAAAASPAAASPGDAAWDGAVFAGPTAPHPTNLSSNPAAFLLAAPGFHYFAGVSTALDQISIDRTLVDAGGARRDGPDVSGRTFGAGGHLGFAKVWPDAVLAFFVQTAPPDETVAGRDALRYHTRGSRGRSADVGTVTFGYRPTRWLWLGIAPSYSVRDGVLRFSRDTAMEAGRDPARGVTSDCGGAPCGLENPLATETWTIDLDADLRSISNFRIAAGFIIVVPGDTLLGVTYQRPWSLGRIERVGKATVIAAPRDGGAVHTGEISLFDQHPEIVRGGTRSRFLERWDLVSEVRWRRTSRIGDDDLRTYGGDLAAIGAPAIYPRPRGLRNAIAVELGMEQVDDGGRWRFGGRVGYDTGAVATHHLSARAPWGRQLTGGGGVQLRIGARWILQGTYNVGWQLPVTVERGAYDPIDRLDCVDSGYDFELPACETVRDGYGAPTNDGDYRRWSHIARLSVRLEVP